MKLMKAVRPLIGCVALLSIVAGATGRGRDSAVLLASEAPALVLNLHFTSSDSLPITSRRALMAEAESIWKNGHVRLKWLRESTEADEGDILRVLVVARPVPRASRVRGVDGRRVDASQWDSGDRDRINDRRKTNRRREPVGAAGGADGDAGAAPRPGAGSSRVSRDRALPASDEYARDARAHARSHRRAGIRGPALGNIPARSSRRGPYGHDRGQRRPLLRNDSRLLVIGKFTVFCYSPRVCSQ